MRKTDSGTTVRLPALETRFGSDDVERRHEVRVERGVPVSDVSVSVAPSGNHAFTSSSSAFLRAASSSFDGAQAAHQRFLSAERDRDRPYESVALDAQIGAAARDRVSRPPAARRIATTSASALRDVDARHGGLLPRHDAERRLRRARIEEDRLAVESHDGDLAAHLLRVRQLVGEEELVARRDADRIGLEAGRARERDERAIELDAVAGAFLQHFLGVARARVIFSFLISCSLFSSSNERLRSDCTCA